MRIKMWRRNTIVERLSGGAIVGICQFHRGIGYDGTHCDFQPLTLNDIATHRNP
jgi:hypothetical protein